MVYEAKSPADRTHDRPDAGRISRRTSAPAFVDDRPATLTTRRLSEAMNASPRVAAQRALSDTLNNRARMTAQRELIEGTNAQPTQRQGAPNEEELLQGKFEPVQRTGPETDSASRESLTGLAPGNVDVHYSSPQSTQLSALDSTQGHDIEAEPEHERPRSASKTIQQTSDVVQRYTGISKGMIFGYGKGQGAAAPQFEFQKQEVVKTPDATTSTTLYDMDTSQVFEDAPYLKVSDNYDMAVPNSEGAESKSFFATPGVIAASNIALMAAAAPLTLAASAGRITLPSLWNPFGISLQQVTPVLPVGMITSSECGTFAHELLGVNVNRIELLTGGGGAPVTTVLAPGMGRDASLNNALLGNAPENIGANKNADPNVGDAFGIFARHVVPPVVVGLMQQLWNEITTVHGLFREKRTHMEWGEHWAGVVAKSGGDYVTLENYNRNAIAVDVLLEQLEKDYSEVAAAGGLAAFTAGTAQYASLPNEWRYQRLARLGSGYLKYAVQLGTITGHYAAQIHNMWYFAMYGRN